MLSPLCDRRQTPGPLESELWHTLYGDEAEIRRRREAMPAKLRRLGIDQAPRSAAILDLCCGHGEGLATLHAMGFRNLSGADLRIDDRLGGDTRFQTRVADATMLPYDDETFDWILNIHSMHHFGSAERVAQFLDQCWRLLKPGGRLAIIDFPASPQILLAFWGFRQNWLLRTRYLRTFGSELQQEWPFLKDYLPQWPKVRRLLLRGRFHVERRCRRFFYFYLTLKKP